MTRVLSRLLFAAAMAVTTVCAQADDKWFSAWTILDRASHGAGVHRCQLRPDVSNSALRMVVRPTIAGKAVRVKLENTMATTPVTFTGAYLGKLGEGAAIDGRNNALTFSGRPGVTIAAGASAFSDPINMDVEAFQRLAVSLEVQSAGEVSGHQLALATNYIGMAGTAKGTSGAGFSPVPQNAGNYPIYYVAALDVRSSKASGTIVALGDSITDGRCSTRDPATERSQPISTTAGPTCSRIGYRPSSATGPQPSRTRASQETAWCSPAATVPQQCCGSITTCSTGRA